MGSTEARIELGQELCKLDHTKEAGQSSGIHTAEGDQLSADSELGWMN